MSFAPLRQSVYQSARYLVSNRKVVSTPFFHRTFTTTSDADEPPGANQSSTHHEKKSKKSDTPKDNSEHQNGSSESPTSPSPSLDPQEEFKKKLTEKDKQLAELQDAYLRCVADQENIRERSRKELLSAKEYAIQSFAKDLLDTVDILNMALTSVPKEFHTKETAEAMAARTKDHDVALSMADQLSNLYTGVSMTEAELVKTLKRYGVERHDPQGEVFDPKLHQALFQAPMPDKPPGTIFSVQKLGYTIKGRILRPAQVGVVSESK